MTFVVNRCNTNKGWLIDFESPELQSNKFLILFFLCISRIINEYSYLYLLQLISLFIKSFSLKCQTIMENSHHSFPEPTVRLSKCIFCPANSPTPKDSSSKWSHLRSWNQQIFDRFGGKVIETMNRLPN